MTANDTLFPTGKIKRIAAIAAMVLFIAGCVDEESAEETAGGSGGSGSESGAGSSGGSGGSVTLTISGSPPSQILVGASLSFTPTVNNPDGVSLTFSATNLPGWASINSSTGEIAGTPGTGDVASYTGIRVTVSGGGTLATSSAYSIDVVAVANGSATLSISGAPPSQVLVGASLSFTPTVNNPDSVSLSYSATSLPGWASINSSTGQVSGTPGTGDVGTYTGIRVTVTGGGTSVRSPAYTIEVMAVANGSATLSWQPPTQNTDGSPLTDLAGFKIYWGQSPASLDNSVTINNAGITTFLVEQLTPATWYFSTTALDADGLESAFSNVASKTIT